MIWLAKATHSSQMYTFGPATNFATSASPLPQNEQANRFGLNMLCASFADVIWDYRS